MLTKKLFLAKTHDYCKAPKPELTVILIHGIASDSSTFNDALKHFESSSSLNNIRFVTFDLLGSGKSIKSDKLTYGYTDQIKALHNSIRKLKVKTPLILIGHSLGTFIVTKYASKHKRAINKLILASPPIYTTKDLEDPKFALSVKAFKKAVSVKNHKILDEKSFNNSINKIVLNKNNYQTLANLKTKTILIYGDSDQLIASYNIPALLKKNPNITAIKTIGRHGVTHDKFNIIRKILEETIHAQNI